MARHNHSGHGHLRASIAQLAARLMAEGLEDFALAKRKAARQLGASESQQLPNNSEIEQALQTYQALYHGEQQRDLIDVRLAQALGVMQKLEPFMPMLIGSIWRGTASAHSDINLLLFAESLKAVELHLLNRGITYKTSEKRLHFSDGWRMVPQLQFSQPDVADVVLIVLRVEDRKQLPLSPVDGRPIQGGRIADLQGRLTAENTPPTDVG